MALAFTKTNGSAIKGADTYKFKDSENRVRLVGGILARYLYWLKNNKGQPVPIECLAFDREQEKFTNEEHDHVPDFFSEAKCQWSYAIKCIDPTDGKVKVFPLKKKLFGSIMDAAKDLGDPTDPDNGWEVVFSKKKTGPLAFNVEYTLNVLRCKPMPLTPEQREAVAAAPTIDVDYPRKSAADIKKDLERLTSGSDESEGEDAGNSAEQEAVNELNA